MKVLVIIDPEYRVQVVEIPKGENYKSVYCKLVRLQSLNCNIEEDRTDEELIDDCYDLNYTIEECEVESLESL